MTAPTRQICPENFLFSPVTQKILIKKEKIVETMKKSSQHSKHYKVLKINKLRFGKCLDCLGMFGKCMQFPKHSKHIFY